MGLAKGVWNFGELVYDNNPWALMHGRGLSPEAIAIGDSIRASGPALSDLYEMSESPAGKFTLAAMAIHGIWKAGKDDVYDMGSSLHNGESGLDDLRHYVKKHNLCLPVGMIKTMEENNYTSPNVLESQIQSLEWPSTQ